MGSARQTAAEFLMRTGRLIAPATKGQAQVEPATRGQRAADKLRVQYGIGGAAAGSATAYGIDQMTSSEPDTKKKKSSDGEDTYDVTLTADEMDLLDRYTRSKTSKGEASKSITTKKATGGKIGRGCGAAMRGGGCVLKKGKMC
jgi:hypothetical protein